jgi:hypothetical protein
MSVAQTMPRAGRTSSGPIRVASVPAGHVYVRHLSDPDGPERVRRLPDVPPADRRTVPGGWWPPVILDADWIAAHHEDFDVFHVHFGFDAKTPEELEAVAGALESAAIPLVVTVHDLRNPHHASPALHEAQLGVLVRAAAEVVTLTPGAAAEIARRWGRRATVLAHPHVVDFATMARPRAARDEFVVGLHAKSLRANMGAVEVAGVLAETVAGLPGARLQINVHHEVFEPGTYYHDAAAGGALRALASDVVDVVEHEYFSDAELWAYLGGLDVSVLPYRFGTHSGWLEACVDLGTAVIAPSCGFYAEQQPVHAYTHDESGLDAASLAAAVRGAYAAAPARRAGVAERRAQRRALAAAHEALYTRALA